MPSLKPHLEHALLVFLALLAAIGACVRVLLPHADVAQNLDNVTLLYLLVGAAILLLPRLKALAFGDYRVEFEQIKEVAEEARSRAEIAEDAALYGLGRQGGQVEDTPAVERGRFHEDPWKEQFGGKNRRNGRVLSATVKAIPRSKGWFEVQLQVSPTQGGEALKGPVQFYIHDTFPNHSPVVPIGPDGIARLTLKAWGAFTVGALADAGETKLELDLAELESAPLEFRHR